MDYFLQAWDKKYEKKISAWDFYWWQKYQIKNFIKYSQDITLCNFRKEDSIQFIMKCLVQFMVIITKHICGNWIKCKLILESYTVVLSVFHEAAVKTNWKYKQSHVKQFLEQPQIPITRGFNFYLFLQLCSCKGQMPE